MKNFNVFTTRLQHLYFGITNVTELFVSILVLLTWMFHNKHNPPFHGHCHFHSLCQFQVLEHRVGDVQREVCFGLIHFHRIRLLKPIPWLIRSTGGMTLGLILKSHWWGSITSLLMGYHILVLLKNSRPHPGSLEMVLCTLEGHFGGPQGNVNSFINHFTQYVPIFCFDCSSLLDLISIVEEIYNRY